MPFSLAAEILIKKKCFS